jgi:hypothetical protein
MPILDDFYRHGELDNTWKQGINPDHLFNEFDQGDVDACARIACPKCGTVGLKYLPFYKAGALGRSFAECPHCNYVYEF